MRKQSIRSAVVLGALAIAALGHAFVPTPDLDRLEIGLSQDGAAPYWQTRDMTEIRSFAPGIDEFLARYGGSWKIQRNEATGTAHMVLGSGTETGRAIGSEADAEVAARAFLEANGNLFRSVDSELVLAKTTNALGKWSVIFNQEYNGLEVRGGRAHAVFTEEGRLFVAGSDFYPNIDISTTPALSEGAAASIAGSDIGFVDGSDTFEGADLLIQPIVSGNSVEYRLVYDVRQSVAQPFGLWSSLVDAQTGDIIRRENLTRFLTVDGNVDGDVYDPHYCGNSLVSRELSQHYVNFTGVGTATSDAYGNFTLEGFTGPTAWNAGLDGPWATVSDYAGADPAQSGTATPGTPLQINWNPGNSDADETSCFIHTNRVHDFIRSVDPGPALDDIDYQYPVSVSRTDGYCPGNAWYDYTGINFCSAGSSSGTDYGNTGEISDVIYHEYGHGITHRVYDSQISPPGDLHEGNSDVIANLLTDESIIGLGFYLDNCTSGIRNSINTLQYPADWTGANHFSGQILAGVVWDAWQELELTNSAAVALQVISDVWHFGRTMMLPVNQPDQVLSMLIADDDDGNLTNGTPHWTEICIGAANHGHDCSALVGLSPEIAVAPGSYDVTTPEGSSEVRDLYITNVGTGILTYTAAGVAAPFAKAALADQVERGLPNTGRPATANRDRTFAFLQQVNADRHAKISAVIFNDDMEGGVNGWTTSLEDGSTDDLWHRQTGNYNSPTTAWWCGIVGGSDYNTGNRISNALISPSITLSGIAPITLEFYESYATESGWDFCNVDVSTDGGSNWTPLRSGISGSSSGWQLTSIDLSAYNGQTIMLRFHFDTTDSIANSTAGWFIDDVSIAATGVTWLTFAPAGGSVAAGETDTVQVTFDAAALTEGDYNATVTISSNDSSDPIVVVPATLHVTGDAVDPDQSTVSANDDAVFCPAGDLATALAITVTARDAGGLPLAGIPAGDVTVDITGTSSLSGQMLFCGQAPNSGTFVSTTATNAGGETTIYVTLAGGCGSLDIQATISSTPITSPAYVSVKSVDFNGDGEINFFDVFEFLPELSAGSGTCGNLDNDGSGQVIFTDTNIFLPHLGGHHMCP